MTKRSSGGVKHDQGKPRIGLVPYQFIKAVATVLTFGAKKYEAWNWIEGFNWERPYSALQRHLGAWWDGEDKDPETGYSHLWHAACNIMFLVIFEQRGIGEDDRHKYEKQTD